MTERNDQSLSMFTIYEAGTGYQAVQWIVEPGCEPRRGSIVDASASLDDLRGDMEARGLVLLPRDDDDAPDIVETWI